MEAIEKYDMNIAVEMNVSQLSKVFVESGFFPNVQSVAQATVKILAGKENGFGPFTSMKDIHLIPSKGGIQIELGSHLHGSKVKASGKYDYRVRLLSNEACEIEFFELSKRTGKWESLGISRFDQDDVARAGLARDFKSGESNNHKKFPRNMLMARAMTNGVEWFCPDVFQSRTYAEGEISGEYMDADPVREDPPSLPEDTPPEEQPQPSPPEPEKMTEKQEALICKLLLSHVWTEEEKEKAEAWLTKSPSKEGAEKFIDSLLTKIHDRKQAEAETKAKAEEEQHEE